MKEALNPPLFDQVGAVAAVYLAHHVRYQTGDIEQGVDVPNRRGLALDLTALFQ